MVYGIVGFNVPLDILHAISETNVREMKSELACRSAPEVGHFRIFRASDRILLP